MNERIGGVSNYQHFVKPHQERMHTGHMDTMGANISIVSINLGNDILNTEQQEYELIPKHKQMQNVPKTMKSINKLNMAAKNHQENPANNFKGHQRTPAQVCQIDLNLSDNDDPTLNEEDVNQLDDTVQEVQKVKKTTQKTKTFNKKPVNAHLIAFNHLNLLK